MSRRWLRKKSTDGKGIHYLFALLAVIATLLLAQWLNQYIPHTSLLLLFMTSVVVVSALTSLGPSVFSGLLSFLSFNFLFTEPYFTLDISHRTDVTTLMLFMLVTTVTGRLAGRMRSTLSAYERALEKLDNLYLFSQKMSSATTQQAVISLLQTAIETNTAQKVQLISKDDASEDIFYCATECLLPIDKLSHIWQNKAISELADWIVFPVLRHKETLALLVTQRFKDTETVETCQTLCSQADIALQRIQLVADLQQTKVTFETEQLRSALLSSVSHDLRTPLASVIGSASSLIELNDKLAPEKQQSLLENILNESERLDRHIQNLLDMTRFGQGKVKLKRDWVDIRDIISGALSRLSDVLHKVSIEVSVEVADPIIHVHGLLIEQALVNVIDNAAYYSPEQGRIQIRVKQLPGKLVIEVADEGSGIADAEKAKVFDMFYSLNQGDQHQRSGAGLGLAIAQGMVGAHGGQISALDDPLLHGALITIQLPWVPHPKAAE